MRSSFSSNTGRDTYFPTVLEKAIKAGGAIIIIGGSTLGVAIADCIFQNNTVTGSYAIGGAVSVFSSPITLVNSTLNSNTVTVTGEVGWGGAVHVVSSPITVVNSTLNNNIVNATGDGAFGWGGAMYADSSSITLVNSTLSSNIVTAYSGWGGAVYALSSPITVVSSTLNNNIVTGDNEWGGAIYADSSPITVVNSALNSNTVTGDVGYGGAVFAKTAPIIVVNSILNSNTVTGHDVACGGAVVALSSHNSTIIVNSTLNSNTATGNNVVCGGAVNGYSSPITIINSTLNSNTVVGQYGGYRYGGAVLTDSSPVTIVNSTLNSNTVTGGHGTGGAVHATSQSSPVTIVNSTLNNNSAGNSGGAVSAISSPITVVNSILSSNSVIGDGGGGGAVYTFSSPNNTIIAYSTLNNNTVTGENAIGGAVYADTSHIVIANSTLNSNAVTGNSGFGGAVFAQSSSIVITSSTLNGNTVQTKNKGSGGAVHSILGIAESITVKNSSFSNNSVTGDGGAFIVTVQTSGRPYVILSLVFIDNSVFSMNSCTGDGSVFYFVNVYFLSSGFLDIQNNMASTSVYTVGSALYFTGNNTVSNNYGSVFVYSCNITFMGDTNILNNSYDHNSRSFNTTDEGGALTSQQSEIVFLGRVNLMYNRAIRGGAIAATQSKLKFFGDITVSHNTASVSGGGIYAYQSELNFRTNINISRNSANIRGGGIHALSSTTRLTDESKTFIIGNHAERGGGMYLEGYAAKVYLLKSKLECLQPSTSNCTSNTSSWITLHLNNNTADYGGAVFVADYTISDTCSTTPFSNKTTIYDECFIQGLNLEADSDLLPEDHRNILNTYITENSAAVDGDVLYGGLLDRCRASHSAEVFLKYNLYTPSSLSAVSYLLNITDLEKQDFNVTKVISSDPVRVCFCKDNLPDCSYRPQSKYVRKEERFTLSLVAVDHINNTIESSTIHASVSLEAKLGEGHSQSIQQTNRNGGCTDLEYSIISPQNSTKLHLYADGPCMNAGISTATLTVNLTPNCPIGFKYKDFRCECDPILYADYITNCFRDSQTLQRKDNVWFSYTNTTHHQSYILHKHCPFDYCHPPTENTSVNLNIEDGADDLCAFNRSGKLCGSCEDGLSLFLGSSRCRPCSNNWLVLLIGFAVAGVALVAFILKLNFTVAEGTFNGLIFYANIFAANSAIFFPRDETKILTVFIAWLNLDFGIETCFFNGMDGYAKTWLQLAFPLYVISLVVAIIIISDYSTKFARLFTGKNPIATLATLILLSYTKLLRTIIASLSFTTLHFSDGSHEVVWLIDANIPYLSGKHIPLFITALVIVIVGTAYTFILFAWQWLVYCPNRGPLRWTIGNTKVIAFMDAYHNPYNKDHRYWIGLLLLVRVVLYLISAVNVLGDPRINLLSVAIVITTLVFFQLVVERKRKIHKKGVYENLERVSLYNLAVLTIATLFSSQNVVAYISTSIAFITFLAILVYHMYQFVLAELFTKISTKHILRRAQSLNMSAAVISVTKSVSMSDEEPVSVTEFDASPLLIESLILGPGEEEKSLLSEDEDVEDTELAEAAIHSETTEYYQPLCSESDDNHPSTISGDKQETLFSHSQTKPLDLIKRKACVSSLTTTSPPSHFLTSCGNKTTIPVDKIELHNPSSGYDHYPQCVQPSVQLVEAIPLENKHKYQSLDSLKANDTTPLLPPH